MDVFLSQPRGFCAGVIRAIDIVEKALEVHAPPVYVVHEIVHNRHVVEGLKEKGAIFVESVEDVPDDQVVIFSAHGVAKSVREHAGDRGLRVIDATCPLVTKVHLQAQRYERKGFELVIIGHQGHVEVEGTRGQVEGPVHVISTVEEVAQLVLGDPEHVSYVTQTTLSIDDTADVIAALKERFPAIRGPELNDICYATQNRQNAVRELAKTVDVLLVVGARNSSNSNRLREVGSQAGLASYLIESADDLEPGWFSQDARVGLTAGASAPEFLVEQVVERLRGLGVGSVTEMDGTREDTYFPLPRIEEFHPARDTG